MSIIQSIIASSFYSESSQQQPTTFVASNYAPTEGNTIVFTISSSEISNGTTLVWWIDGTSNGSQLADQFVENVNNGTVVLSNNEASFSLTPVVGSNRITFNIYIGYSLYQGFINLPSDVNIYLNKNDFTVEWWQKMTNAVSNNDRLFEVGSWPAESIGFSEELIASGLFVWTGGSYNNTSLSIPTLYNTWVHFAICRKNGILRLYKDGNYIISASNQNEILDNQNELVIGGSSNNINNFNGYLTNFHFVKGTAKYDSNFTPSTTPLTPISTTKLLLLTDNTQDAFIDSSSTHTVNLTGATWSSESPFNTGGSLYFDGSSHISFPANEDWAIDGQIK